MIFLKITLRQIGSYGKDKDSTEVIPRKTFHFPFEEKTRRKCQEQHNGRKGYEEENPNLFWKRTESLDNLNQKYKPITVLS